MIRKALFLASGILLGFSCQPTSKLGQLGQQEQIPPHESRKTLFPFAELVSAFDQAVQPGESFGMPADKIPYPDTYWPMIDNGLLVNWLEKDGTLCETVPTDSAKAIARFGRDVTPDDDDDEVHACNNPQPSPLEKVMGITRPEKLADAMAWEQRFHGIDVLGVAPWFGHCPGWAGSTHIHAPLDGPAFAKSDGLGGLTGCAPGELGCVKFEIGDINALQSEIFEGAESKFIGARCDKKLEDIQRDEFGRIIDEGCDGVNFGALLIIAATSFQQEGRPFNIDAQEEFNTAEIWNQPAFRYTIHSSTGLTETEASERVASGAPERSDRFDGRTLANYSTINPNAKGWALVDMSLHWVAETSGPNTERVSGALTAQKTRMVGIVELDKPFGEAGAEIIGGELLDDPFVGASRLKNQPFIWVADGPSPDVPEFQESPTVKRRRNPYLKVPHVNKLIELSRAQSLKRGDRGTDTEKTCSDIQAEFVSCLGGQSAFECVSQLGNGDHQQGLTILKDCNLD